MKEIKIKRKYNPSLDTEELTLLVDDALYDELLQVFIDYSRLIGRQHMEELRHVIYMESIDELKAPDAMSLEDEIIRIEEMETVQRALRSLTDTQRRRLLAYFGGSTYREIAKGEGVSPNAIVYSINGGIKKLQEILRNTLYK